MAVADKLKALRVKANLIADSDVGWMEISTEVRDGVAILTGRVDTEKQKQIAEELAYETDGIEEVWNRIRISPPNTDSIPMLKLGHFPENYEEFRNSASLGNSFPEYMRDDQIEAELMRKLERSRRIDSSTIEFHSSRQIVHIRGFVDTQENLHSLQEMILSIHGVLGIFSEIVVQNSGGLAGQL